MAPTRKARAAFPALEPIEPNEAQPIVTVVRPWDTISDGTIAEREQVALRDALPRPQVQPPRAKPTMTDLLARHGIRLVSASTAHDRLGVANRPEADDIIARITVYAMNLSVLVFVFPLGLALLIFNVIGGENLRTTAHAMALTGMAMGLSMTDVGARILGFG